VESLILKPFGKAASMRLAYGEALVALGRERPDLVVLSADVQSSDYSYMFEEAYPQRFFNVGIAFLFVTRALEMVRTHLCYGGANVKLAGAYAGLSDSFDGPTHQTVSDLAILRSLPNMTIVVPADAQAVRKLLPKIVAWDGPVYFRLGRNEVPQVFNEDYDPEIGKGVILRAGTDATIIACGLMVARALQAAEQLSAENISLRVVEMHTIKPLDAELITRCAAETGAIVTAEEHSIVGGLGGAVSECVAERYLVPVERVGITDTFAESGPYEELLNKYGLTAGDIVAAVHRVLARRNCENRAGVFEEDLVDT
jgi:transketolase